jgi:hypothetical protein
LSAARRFTCRANAIRSLRYFAGIAFKSLMLGLRLL